MSDLGDKDSTVRSFIDSRHLYINHMDPLKSVVTIFHRMIGDQEKETTKMKGAILCLWPGRRVEHEEDVLKMNPVYPAMLAFAERVWKAVVQKDGLRVSVKLDYNLQNKLLNLKTVCLIRNNIILSSSLFRMQSSQILY